MQTFKTHDEASANAWGRVDRGETHGQDLGIERINELFPNDPMRWKVTFLPKPKHSYGRDATIERVPCFTEGGEW